VFFISTKFRKSIQEGIKMKKEEFLALDPKAKGAALQAELDGGKNYEDILAEIGMTKKELEIQQGIYLVKGKFMVKLMAGYQNRGTGKDIL
jgi:hypothetical protein